MNNIKENLRLWGNKLRIWFLTYFTNRVKHVTIEDPKTGEKLKATIEKQEEKVCAHRKIQQVAGTIWECECKQIYFEINYKVMLHRPELIGFLDEMANHLKHDWQADQK